MESVFRQQLQNHSFSKPQFYAFLHVWIPTLKWQGEAMNSCANIPREVIQIQGEKV